MDRLGARYGGPTQLLQVKVLCAQGELEAEEQEDPHSPHGTGCGGQAAEVVFVGRRGSRIFGYYARCRLRYQGWENLIVGMAL